MTPSQHLESDRDFCPRELAVLRDQTQNSKQQIALTISNCAIKSTLYWGLLFVLLNLVTPFNIVCAQDSGASLSTRQVAESTSHAVIESAVYSAKFENGDLTEGNFEWKVLHRGEQSALIDLTESNLALHRLRNSNREVVWGTTNRDQRVVLVDGQIGSFQGEWSRHGRKFPGTTRFECQFPNALNTKLFIETPVEILLKASTGYLESKPMDSQPAVTHWTLDLGRNRSVTLNFSASETFSSDRMPKVEAETVHVARQDGIFVQTNFSLENLNSKGNTQIEIQMPRTFVVQTVTSSGVALPFVRDTAMSASLKLAIPQVIPRTRVNLKIQGFQPVRWVRPHVFPALKVSGAIETKRVTTLRIETPLELHNFETKGFFQSGLTKESRGEVWRFEAFAENPELTVDLGQPRHSLRADIHTLANYDTPLPWVATKVTTSVKSGRLFTLTLAVPANWKIIKIVPLTPDSKISSWVEKSGELEISFEDPISPESRKFLEILSRVAPLTTQSETRLSCLLVRNATTTSLQTDWILPATRDVDFPPGSHWSLLTSEIDQSRFGTAPKSFRERNANPRQKSYFNTNLTNESAAVARVFLIGEGEDGKLEAVESIDSQLNATEFPNPSERTKTASLRLSTQADSLEDRPEPQLVHHATIECTQPTTFHELQLALPESCLVSSVSIDGRSVTAFREGNGLHFPENVPNFTEMTLIYMTQTETRFLHEACTIPLPQANLEFIRFDWTLEIPEERSLTAIQLNETKLKVPAARFWFGPLSDRFFSLSGEAAMSEEFHQLDLTRGAGQGIRRYQFHALDVGQAVQFESWNLLQASHLGWVVFLACLIVGVGGRLIDSRLIRRVSPFWLFTLLVLQLFIRDEFSMICGAMLGGTLISMLLPVELLKLSGRRIARRSFQDLVPAAILIGAVFLSGPSGIVTSEAQESFPLPPTNPTEVPYLLESVQYEHLESIPHNLFHARVTVLTSNQRDETLVELPYNGVIFPSGALCLIDGVPKTLIPAVNGGGVVIRIHRGSEATLTDQKMEWSRHTVEFDFMLSGPMQPEAELKDNSTIPSILDATFVSTGAMAAEAGFSLEKVSRNGDLRAGPNDEFRIALGPVRQLTFNENEATHSPDLLNQYLQLSVSSSRIEGQFYQISDSPSAKSDAVFTVPSQAVVTLVTGASVAQWFLSVGPSRKQSLIVEYKPFTTDRTTIVSFYLPTALNTNQEIVIPELSWSEKSASQIFGLRVPNGLAMNLVENQNGVEMMKLTSWPQNEVFGRTRPDQVVKLSEPRDLRVSLNIVSASSRHSLTQTLSVERSKLAWEAELKIENLDLPVFVQTMNLQGGLQIQSVRMPESGANSFLRFHQEGTELSIFIPGGQLGNQKLLLTGEVSFTSEKSQVIPGLLLHHSNQSAETLTILDTTNWDIQLTTPTGTKLTKTAMRSEDFKSSRIIGVFDGSAPQRPREIRLQPPPTATRVDIATRLQIDDRKNWNSVQLLRFSGEETPLKKVNFSIPKELGPVRIGPRYFRAEQVETESGIEVSIPIPERYSDGVTIQVYSKFPPGLIEQLLGNRSTDSTVEIPEISVTSARTATRLLFFNENRLITTPSTESVLIEQKNMPSWIPAPWLESLSNSKLLAYQVLNGKPILQAQAVFSQNEDPVLHFAETAIWSGKSGQVAGLTRFWLTGGPFFEFHIPLGEKLRPTHAFIGEKSEIPLIRTVTGTQVEIDSNAPVIPLTVYWQSSKSVHADFSAPFTIISTQSISHLIGIVGNSQFSLKADQDSISSVTDAWLYRWGVLLDMAEKVTSPISLDHDLQQELRVCQNTLREYLETPGMLNSEQVRFIEEYQVKWKSLLESMTIAVDAVITTPHRANMSFGALLASQNEFQTINWIQSQTGKSISLTSSSDRPWPNWMKISIRLLMIAILLAIVLKSQRIIRVFLSRLESEPVLSLLLLGGIWLLFLKPLIISFVLFFMALVLHLFLITQPQRPWSQQN